ncbi:hypothetical protein ACRC6Q_16580 [Planococcus sp. SE5232]|uniref:hypothetical protein n=1 Tax=unclassified Planococcus (in: firmicutes) TaxID=2662419 RepID=UPI003D6C415E
MDNYIANRQHTLNLLVITAGSWMATGCKDEALEQKFDSLLYRLHPARKTALAILQQHLEEPAA